MTIAPNTVVSFHYRLSQTDGPELENSQPGEPMAYLHGHGAMLPAVEQALEGHAAGEQVSLTLPPEQAYGLRREGSQQRIPVKHVLFKGKLAPGIAVKINTSNGPRDVQVIKVGRYTVDVDTNHPFAGMTLCFEIDIVAVRPASPEELSHGHVHGPGGHHH